LPIDSDRGDLQSAEVEVECAQVEQRNGVDRDRAGGDCPTGDVEVEVQGVVLNVVPGVAQQGIVGIADAAATGGTAGSRRCRNLSQGRGNGHGHQQAEPNDGKDRHANPQTNLPSGALDRLDLVPIR
jgi:hypothetical protein